MSAVDAGGHFLYTTMHQTGADVAGLNGEPSVLMFGTGDYRNSEVYLARIPTAKFETGMGTRYFTGLVNGRPTWTRRATTAQEVLDNQRQAVPVFFDARLENGVLETRPERVLADVTTRERLRLC